MEKAPDAFRTISEVADELDIPQHVLRFWETRFVQIKPMKRSGGRRYYRPDDVDLLKGIRRLLYGEGYTIRGVQRILKEQGIKSVQRLADAEASATFGAVEAAIHRTAPPDDELEPAAGAGIDVDADEDDGDDDDLELHAAMAEPELRSAPAASRSAIAPEPRRTPLFDDEADDDARFVTAAPVGAQAPRFDLPPLTYPSAPAPVADLPPPRPPVDLAPLRAALQDLIACRDLLDAALNDTDGRSNPAAPGPLI